nr:MAG TPA: hypothetical protein [Caudoviricetes sp.]
MRTGKWFGPGFTVKPLSGLAVSSLSHSPTWRKPQKILIGFTKTRRYLPRFRV